MLSIHNLDYKTDEKKFNSSEKNIKVFDKNWGDFLSFQMYTDKSNWVKSQLEFHFVLSCSIDRVGKNILKSHNVEIESDGILYNGEKIEESISCDFQDDKSQEELINKFADFVLNYNNIANKINELIK